MALVQRVFRGQKKMNLQNESTSSTSLDEVWTCLDVDLGAVSHTGHIRESNQDSYLVMKFGRSLENLMTNLAEDLFEQNYVMSGYGMLVADGMGGMAGGDFRLDTRSPAPERRYDCPGTNGRPLSAVRRYFEKRSGQ
jgi:hypothetical protein